MATMGTTGAATCWRGCGASGAWPCPQGACWSPSFLLARLLLLLFPLPEMLFPNNGRIWSRCENTSAPDPGSVMPSHCAPLGLCLPLYPGHLAWHLAPGGAWAAYLSCGTNLMLMQPRVSFHHCGLLSFLGHLDPAEKVEDAHPKLWCALNGGKVVVFDASSWTIHQHCFKVGNSKLVSKPSAIKCGQFQERFQIELCFWKASGPPVKVPGRPNPTASPHPASRRALVFLS